MVRSGTDATRAVAGARGTRGGEGLNVSTGARRIVAWSVGAVCSAVVICLVVTAAVDLPVADSTASVVAAVVAVIGLGLSGITLLRDRGSSGPGGGRTVRVRARGSGSIAAGGDLRGNAIGARSTATGAAGPRPAAARPGAGRTSARAARVPSVRAGTSSTTPWARTASDEAVALAAGLPGTASVATATRTGGA